MWSTTATLAAACALTGMVNAAPAPVPADKRFTLFGIGSSYAPVAGSCPAGSLNRPATSINPSEAAYVTARSANAKPALASWLKKVNSGFGTTSVPNLAIAASGGGYRAMLNSAGVVQAFDSRDSSSGTAGLLQGATYFGALSGGGWLLSSLVGNNWPTVSNLRDSLWTTALENTLLVPGGVAVAIDDSEIVSDLTAKDEAGFTPTLVDLWGRLLSYQLLKGSDGDAAQTFSGVTSMSSFTSASFPFPIMTSLGLVTEEGQCVPNLSSTQYEFTPYEFGSWDSGVAAFTKTQYLGTSMNNGVPSGQCITNFDNLGFVLGTQSDYLGVLCGDLSSELSSLTSTLEGILAKVEPEVTDETLATYPNPFYNSAASSAVSALPNLRLTDGGIGGQNDPLWPFLQPERAVSVIIVSDESADTSNDLPDGTSLHDTYLRASATGLTKMPVIPPNTTFVSQGLNTHATFFGCNDPNAVTLIWLPNVPYTFASNTSTTQLEYSQAQTDGMIANGNAIALQNGDANWPTCLACGIQKKTGSTLPAACTACFAKYCYN